eukprot:GILJ01017482.1.p2 GENE.GILJ01017482.1~~GILJ01017482.1.p2  ORF type:complete len:110 (-),score=8.05 GILJ01017482.1:87-416(-)
MAIERKQYRSVWKSICVSLYVSMVSVILYGFAGCACSSHHSACLVVSLFVLVLCLVDIKTSRTTEVFSSTIFYCVWTVGLFVVRELLPLDVMIQLEVGSASRVSAELQK